MLLHLSQSENILARPMFSFSDESLSIILQIFLMREV